jgi:hypothetical protein
MVVTGLVVLAAGLGWLALVRADTNYWVDVLPASLLAATGIVRAEKYVRAGRGPRRVTGGRRA